MGSLPNLDHAIERREREKERVLQRERAREREFCHDLDSWRERAQSIQAKHNKRPFGPPPRRVIRTRSSGNTHHLINEPLENLIFLNKGPFVPANFGPKSKSHGLSNPTGAQHQNAPQLTVGLVGVPINSSNNPPAHHHPHHYHQHNVIQAQNSNPSCAVVSRRRESVSSSIGAASVRRLLTINRGCRHKIPVQVRAAVIKNFVFLVVGHGLISAALMPLMGLQASNSIWFDSGQSIIRKEGGDSVSTTTPLIGRPPSSIGSILLSFSFLLTSATCFFTSFAIKKMGHYSILLSGYVGVAVFLAFHFYPTYYTLIPAHIILGIVFGPTHIAKVNLVTVMANKLSCGLHECNALSTPTANPSVDNDEPTLFATKTAACSRDENIRRLARWFHASQDLGIIFGAIIASLLLTCAAFNTPDSSAYLTCMGQNRSVSTYLPIVVNEIMFNSTGSAFAQDESSVADNQAAVEAEVAVVENYNTNHGLRICGAASCPVWMHASYVPLNVLEERYSVQAVDMNSSGSDTVISRKRAFPNVRLQVTIGLFLVLCLIAISCTVGLRKFTSKGSIQQSRSNSVPGLADTLFFAGPMAYFIGTEQGYILADFTKSYVSCSLGPHKVAGIIIGYGLMQLIASCTLSMLLRHTKRLVVIIAGSFFHACLLLVLARWNPSFDDSALFYVIAAAWGFCNAVWETLLFALLSLTHKNHMVDVVAPIQSIKFLALGVTFGAHGFLCEYSKIIVLAILLIVSVPPYTSLEIRQETQRKAVKGKNMKSVLQVPTL